MEVWLSGDKGAGLAAQVDPVDYNRVIAYSWYLRDGYAVSLINGRYVKLHRFVMMENDPSVVIDHINRDRLDCRSENLRRITAAENANNRVDNVLVTAFGESQTIAEWSRDPRCGCSYHTLQKRIYRGLNAELSILAAEN
jgi:hypothetical protein